MGTWHGPTARQTLWLALDAIDPHAVLPRTEIIEALERTGIIVPQGFYVPDMDELYGLMRQWSFHMAGGMKGARWVMCQETINVLARRERDKLASPPPRFDKAFWADGPGAELPTAALSMEIVRVMEANSRWSDQAKLFGFPIRIDPAARSPLFEIDPEATTR